MEFNLLKHIEKPLGHFPPNLHILQSSSHATDFVNPGVGNVNKKYSVFVPLHSAVLPTHTSSKVKSDSSPALDQKGFGEIASKPPAAGDSNHKSEKPEDEVEQLNSRKRKLVGDEIFESFMNPKVKTSVLKQFVKREERKTEPLSEPATTSGENISSKAKKFSKATRNFKLY